MNKIIAIDASSNAIGVAIWNGEKLEFYTSIHVTKKNLTGSERVVEIIKKFSQLWDREIPEATKSGIETLVMNTGFAQGNDIDAGLRYLKRVQHIICYMLCDRLELAEAPVLDISWLNALAEFIGWKQDKNILKKRENKKKATVIAAVKLIHDGKHWKTVKLIEKEWYEYQVDGVTHKISDDAADAIFCGWSYQTGKVSQQTLINKKEKNRLEKIEVFQKQIDKLDKNSSTLESALKKLSKEIIEIQGKPESKTKENSLQIRKTKMENKSAQLRENNLERNRLLQEIEKVKGKQ